MKRRMLPVSSPNEPTRDDDDDDGVGAVLGNDKDVNMEEGGGAVPRQSRVHILMDG